MDKKGTVERWARLAIQTPGWNAEIKRKRWKFTAPDGVTLIFLPLTPSCKAGMRNAKSRLEKAGLEVR